jgi:hypothetical protein
MKLIIAGSRDLSPSYHIIRQKLEEVEWFLKVKEVVSGKARGADRAGEEFARQYEIPVKEFPADWDRYGKAAGPIRNRQMAEYADALLLIWDGRSPGSKNMKKEMERLKKPVHEIIMMTIGQRIEARNRNQRERPQRPDRNQNNFVRFGEPIFRVNHPAADIQVTQTGNFTIPIQRVVLPTFTVPADTQINLRGVSVGYTVRDEMEDL